MAPMTYTYKQHGKPVKESAAFAVALKRTQAGALRLQPTLSTKQRGLDGLLSKHLYSNRRGNDSPDPISTSKD